MTTLTHIANPEDSRCKWFQSELKKDLNVSDLQGVKFEYYKRNADLELQVGTLLIDWEENHHAKQRGSTTHMGIATEEKVVWMKPTIEMKKLIKSEGHHDLMVGSGDIVACVRIAIYLNRQENKFESFIKLKEIQI